MSLRKKSLLAIVWNSAGGVTNIVITFLISVVLSRLLGPSEFGLLSLAMSFIALSEGMVVMGFHTSIIRHEHLEDIDISSIFILNLVLGALFTVVFFVSAPWIAHWYGKEALSPILKVLSFIFIINGSTLVHRAYMERNLNYKWLNIARVTALIISGVIGIGMAYEGYGVWSLVFSTISVSIVSAIILWSKSGWRLSFKWNLNTIKEHWNFSLNVFGANLIASVTSRLDVLLLGKFQTASTLGLFNRGKSLNDMGTRIPAQFILKPLFSSLSKIQNDKANMRDKTRSIYRIISFLFIPAFIFGIGFAPEVIRFLYGEKWMGTVPFLRVFLAIGILHIMRIPNNYILLARGKSNKVFRLELVLNVVRIVLIALIAPIDIMALLYALLVLKIAEYILYISQSSAEISADPVKMTLIWGQYLLMSVGVLLPLRWGLNTVTGVPLRLFMGLILFGGCYFIYHYYARSKAWTLVKTFADDFRTARG